MRKRGFKTQQTRVLAKRLLVFESFSRNPAAVKHFAPAAALFSWMTEHKRLSS